MEVGLILPLAEDPRLGRAPLWAETRRSAHLAEVVGFDAIWVYDHLLHRFPGHPEVGFREAWTTLTALAETTSRPGSSLKIGAAVLCAGFRNPAVLAKMAVTLDEISGGRLILGLGAGWHEPEFRAFGVPFDHRVSRFEEALRIIVPLLRGGRVDFSGTYFTVADTEIRPRGPRPGGPPIVIAAFGPRMLRLAATYAEAWNTDWLGPLKQVATQRARVAAACVEIGRDPATLAITGGVTVAYPDLGPLPSWLTHPADGQALTGSAEAVASGLHGYAEAGVSHALCSVYPHNEAAIRRLGEALATFRAAR